MNILITGASGFIGSWLVKVAAEYGHQVTCGVRRSSNLARLEGIQQDRPGTVDIAFIDLMDRDSIFDAVEQAAPEAIIHAAAYGVDYRQRDPVIAAHTNIMGTLWLWKSAQEFGVKRFVHLGTSYEYGSNSAPITEATPLDPVGTYGTTKAAASQLLRTCGQAGAPDPLIFRLFGVFGPGEGTHKLVPQVIRACRDKAPLELTEGAELRDYMYIGDAAHSIVKATTLSAAEYPAGDTFNLCSGKERSIRGFVSDIAEHYSAVDQMRFGARAGRTANADRVVGDRSRWVSFCRTHGLDELIQLTQLDQILENWP